MVALSELLGVPMRATDGTEIGRVRDVIVRVDSPASAPAGLYPRVVGVAVEGEAEVVGGGGGGGVDGYYVPWGLVKSRDSDGMALRERVPEVRPVALGEAELGLRQGLLDRHVVDVAHVRLVRVNDVELGERDGTLCLIAVDVGPRALLRRLGFGSLGDRLLARLGGSARPSGPLDWSEVVPLPEGDERAGAAPAWLRTRATALARLDSDELADLAGNLTPRQAAALLTLTDASVAAAALEQMDDVQQAQVLRAMEPERAADVLDEMDPDEATDALQALRAMNTEEADDLIGRMEHDEADDVRELSEYPGDTAGGLMTTDFVAVPARVKAGAVLEALRARSRAAAAGEADPVPEALGDVYVVDADDQATGLDGGVTLDAEGRLLGIVGLRELVLADPAAALGSVMRDVDATARPLDDARTVARAIADADMVALPITDDDGRLLGIVTVDDAIDVILPGQWRARASRRSG